jgi:hypothetical protein
LLNALSILSADVSLKYKGLQRHVDLCGAVGISAYAFLFGATICATDSALQGADSSALDIEPRVILWHNCQPLKHKPPIFIKLSLFINRL